MEILFRLLQEGGNLYDLLNPRSKEWADAERIRMRPGIVPAQEHVAELATEIRANRIPLFDRILETGPEIQWRRDYENGVTTGLDYFRRIPYLDRNRVGDHKNVWELNRHQHLVVLAQDAMLHDNLESLAVIEKHISSWRAQNPYLRGINWTSALEVAFRALSWLWVWHLAADRLSVAARREILLGLEEHGRYLERNLSVFFSPNTHLLGEALALHALGLLMPGIPGAERWLSVGRRVMLGAMDHQVRADGSHFEQSTYYHVYALDMFLFHAILEEPPQAYLDSLRRMGEFLAALLGDAGRIPLMGDDDGGRLFHPYGRRDEFGRDSLAALGCYLGEPAMRRLSAFTDTGLVRLVVNGCDVWFDCGPFGPGGAGHSHADALQIVMRFRGEEILIDAGTYTYVGDVRERDRFRGTAMHNTVRIGGLDQATPAGPFRWRDLPEVKLLSYEDARASAECRYRGYIHRRDVELAAHGEGAILTVVDTISREAGLSGESVLLEQFWHMPLQAAKAGEIVWQLGGDISVEEGGEFGWRSLVFGQREPAVALCARYRSKLPAVLTAEFLLGTTR